MLDKNVVFGGLAAMVLGLGVSGCADDPGAEIKPAEATQAVSDKNPDEWSPKSQCVMNYMMLAGQNASTPSGTWALTITQPGPDDKPVSSVTQCSTLTYQTGPESYVSGDDAPKLGAVDGVPAMARGNKIVVEGERGEDLLHFINSHPEVRKEFEGIMDGAKMAADYAQQWMREHGDEVGGAGPGAAGDFAVPPAEDLQDSLDELYKELGIDPPAAQ